MAIKDKNKIQFKRKSSPIQDNMISSHLILLMGWIIPFQIKECAEHLTRLRIRIKLDKINVNRGASAHLRMIFGRHVGSYRHLDGLVFGDVAKLLATGAAVGGIAPRRRLAGASDAASGEHSLDFCVTQK